METISMPDWNSINNFSQNISNNGIQDSKLADILYFQNSLTDGVESPFFLTYKNVKVFKKYFPFSGVLTLEQKLSKTEKN